MKILSILSALIAKFRPPKSLSELASLSGVKMGEKENNIIYSDFWKAAEPYLIEIGNNCQITKGVNIYTHGGGPCCTLFIS